MVQVVTHTRVGDGLPLSADLAHLAFAVGAVVLAAVAYDAYLAYYA